MVYTNVVILEDEYPIRLDWRTGKWYLTGNITVQFDKLQDAKNVLEAKDLNRSMAKALISEVKDGKLSIDQLLNVLTK